MNPAMPAPLDVKLMNMTASLLVTGLVLACIAAGLWWVLRSPAFAIGQITVNGTADGKMEETVPEKA